MEILVENFDIRFKGFLDESAPWPLFQESLAKAKSAARGNRVRLDLSGVEGGNSHGLLKWIDVLDRFSTPATYVNVPVWLVEQFNYYREFTLADVLVESIQAFFFCPDTGRQELLTLAIGKDVPVREDYSDFTLSFQREDGTRLEPDFYPDQYFYFIGMNFERFKNALG